jgi:drug/metabolite transporter (DMT)-like permease
MNSPKANHRRTFDPNALTARDILVIVPVVIGLFALSILLAFSVSHEVYIRWGGLALDTAVLFGLYINYSRKFFRKWQFWALTALLLAVHLTVFAVVLTHVEEWKLMWFTVMVFEYPLFIYARSRFLPYPS